MSLKRIAASPTESPFVMYGSEVVFIAEKDGEPGRYIEVNLGGDPDHLENLAADLVRWARRIRTERTRLTKVGRR